MLPASTSGLKAREWKRFLKGPDASLLEELYVPGLASAEHYDRCCSYYSSSVLASAARGFGKLIERLEAIGKRAPRPAVRLVVNETLAEEDVQAMLESGDLSALEKELKSHFKRPQDILEKRRLEMLAWLVKKDLLAIRVGVMRRGEGIVHAKFGIMRDESGDAVVFSGSGNESASGLEANYERLEVSTSWEDPERHREYASEFEALWGDVHADVHTVTLPEALRLELIKYAPPDPPMTEPSNALARQKAAMIWQFIAEAPYLATGATACDATAMVDLWPHQKRVVEETAGAWPAGRLLCDEVGMGKTIEAICIVRRLLAGRGVARVLFLLPASIVKQWQAELREKGGLLVPRLEGQNTVIWPGGAIERVSGLADALKQDLVLISRETARTENNLSIIMEAEPWDLVVLDESHAARRKKQVEGEFNSGTLLLNLIRELQLRGRTKGFLLLSATPMQTHPWEPWDLLTVLGEGGAWLPEFKDVRDYYTAVLAVQTGRQDPLTLQKAASLIAADAEAPLFSGGADRGDAKTLLWKMQSNPVSKRHDLTEWMRSAAPLGRRMHRNTKETLKEYFRMGLLTATPPERRIEDVIYDYEEARERRVYEAIKFYIDERFDQLESERSGKGFVMTVYRRRASSSPQALERSLERRLSGLRRVAKNEAYEADLINDERLDSRDLSEADFMEEPDRISTAYPSDPKVAHAESLRVSELLDQIRGLQSADSKRDRFYQEIKRVTDDGRGVLIFTEYIDTMEYVRDNLRPSFGTALGCFSGDGGQLWDGTAWIGVTKDVITDKLRDGTIKVMVCTDAASEGLNLQAAGAIVNYDLPWNPSRVEQRIGRIDRIGQKLDEIRVVNFFLKNSVDERVYKTLRMRCGLFEHFVGAMQPVLSAARAMLLGFAPDDVNRLEQEAQEIESDILANETYVNSRAMTPAESVPALTREQVKEALSYLGGEIGIVAVPDRKGTVIRIRSDAGLRFRCSQDGKTLERDDKIIPLSPLGEIPSKISIALTQPGEHLPLVVGTHQQGGLRTSVIFWVGDGKLEEISSFGEVCKRCDGWEGNLPTPELWVEALDKARDKAMKSVKRAERRNSMIFDRGRSLQVEAAKLRLQKELGRFLICAEDGVPDDMNEAFGRQMNRDTSSARRIRDCYEKLEGYPEWSESMIQEMKEFHENLTSNVRSARLLGSELAAAMEDPRWEAADEH